jgi:hypothetical protein
MLEWSTAKIGERRSHNAALNKTCEQAKPPVNSGICSGSHD